MNKARLFLAKSIGWIFCLLIFLISVVFCLVTYDSNTIKITIMQLGMLVIAGIWIARSLEFGRIELPVNSLSIAKPALVLVIWLILSWFWNPYKTASFHYALNSFIFLLTFLAALSELGESYWAEHIWDVTVSALGVIVSYGALQHFGLDPFAWKGAFGSRVFSSTGNPELLGGFIVVLFPLLWMGLSRASGGRFGVRRIVATFLILPTSACLAWAQSPKALAGFVLLCLIFSCVFFWVNRKGIAFKLPLLGMVISLATVLLLASNFQKQANHDFKLLRHVWPAAISMIKDNPITGVGIGGFAVHFPKYRSAEIIRMEKRHVWMTYHAENEFLETFAELGIVGFSLLLWLWFMIGKKFLQAVSQLIKQRAVNDLHLVMGYGLCALAIFILNLFSGISPRFVFPGWIYMCLVGVGTGVASRYKSDASKTWVYPLSFSTSLRRTFSVFLLLFFLMLAKWPIVWFKSDQVFAWARGAAQFKEYAKAKNYFGKVDILSLDYTMANYFIGQANFDQGDYESAVKDYQKINTLFPHYVLTDYKLGQAYRKLGRCQEAIESYKTAITIDPVYPDIYKNMAECYEKLGNTIESQTMRQQAVELEKSNPATLQ